MAEIDERLGEVGHDTLGAAVEFRRNGFVKRRDLGNSHGCSPVSTRGAVAPMRIPCKVAELAGVRGGRYVAVPRRVRGASDGKLRGGHGSRRRPLESIIDIALRGSSVFQTLKACYTMKYAKTR